MKKREVYEAWRFPCEVNMFRWNKDLLDWDYTEDIGNMVARTKSELLRVNCPCGKGCKPIKCKIIVENEIGG